MLQLANEADDRDTVCASSQDSCSTISLFSTSDAEARSQDRAADQNLPAPPASSLLTELNYHMGIALHPSSVTAVPCDLRDSESQKSLVTLRLRWSAHLPALGASKTFASRCASSSSLTSVDASAVNALKQSALGKTVLHSEPLYLTYQVPAPIDGEGLPNAPDRVVLALPIGRDLFHRAFHIPPPHASHATVHGMSQIEDLVETTISRHHTDVILFLSRSPASSSGSLAQLSHPPPERQPSLSFQSVDVVDLASNTTINGVLLARHHRYHFNRSTIPLTRQRGGSFSDRAIEKVVSLGVGDYASVDIHYVKDTAAHGESDVLEKGDDNDDGGDAVLVYSKGSKSTRSSASAAVSFSPNGISNRQGTDISTRTEAALNGAVRKAGQAARQTVYLPSRASTIVSSAAAATDVSAVEDCEDSLLASLPLSVLGSGEGHAGGGGVSSPLGRKQQAQAARQKPLPRLRKETATSTRKSKGRSKQHALAVDSASNSNSPPPPAHDREAAAVFLSNRTSDGGDSSSLSTPSSMRNSTWTETFIDTMGDSPDNNTTATVHEVREGTARATLDSAVRSSAKPALRNDRRRVIFTTGMRLNEGEEKALSKLGFSVNPDLKKASAAELLVVQRPLMRSVKLLTVLPYVDGVVQRQWLDEVIEGKNSSLAADRYPYAERRTASSIEGANDFTLADTLRVSPAVRQQLLAAHTFWVHPQARPQEPPANDLRTVITASGGKIAKHSTQATVLILAEKRTTRAALQAVAKEMKCSVDNLLASSTLLIYPDDLFRAILQQKPLVQSCVEISSTQSESTASPSRSRGRRSVAVSTLAAKATRTTPTTGVASCRTSAGPVSRRTSARAPSQKTQKTGRKSGASPTRKSARKE